MLLILVEGGLDKSAIMITFGIKIMSVDILLDVLFYASPLPMIDSFSCIPVPFNFTHLNLKIFHC